MMDKLKLQELGGKRAALLRNDSVDKEARTAEFVISTEAVDSYNTVFKSDGWDFSRYANNPVVFYQHDTHSKDPDVVIGVSEIRVENGEVIGKVTFEDAELNPLADKILRKIMAGTLRGASINADVQDGRFGDKDLNEDPDILYFTRQTLMEWSIVTVPSNPDALKRSKETIDALKAEDIKDPEPDPKTMSIAKARFINNLNHVK